MVGVFGSRDETVLEFGVWPPSCLAWCEDPQAVCIELDGKQKVVLRPLFYLGESYHYKTLVGVALGTHCRKKWP